MCWLFLTILLTVFWVSSVWAGPAGLCFDYFSTIVWLFFECPLLGPGWVRAGWTIFWLCFDYVLSVLCWGQAGWTIFWLCFDYCLTIFRVPTIWAGPAGLCFDYVFKEMVSFVAVPPEYVLTMFWVFFDYFLFGARFLSLRNPHFYKTMIVIE